jgi:hypothetical protein
MAGLYSAQLTYCELYSEPTNNPFGVEDKDTAEGYRMVYEMWRATNDPPTVGVLH